MLIDDVTLPPPRVGDLLAVPATGAYTLAMSSNYNATPRPAAVLVARRRCAGHPPARDRRRPAGAGGLSWSSASATTSERTGFGWIVEEAMTRTSHALAADGQGLARRRARLARGDRSSTRARGAGRSDPAPRPARPRLRRARGAARRAARRRARRPARQPVHVRSDHAEEALARVRALVAADAHARRRRRARDEPLLHGREGAARACTCSCG